MSKENQGANSRARQERHAKRMAAQLAKRGYDPVFGCFDGELKVPRGTARNERRKPLQLAYAKRMVNAAE